jgi:hypothetical protein
LIHTRLPAVVSLAMPRLMGLEIKADLLPARRLADRFVLNRRENFEPFVRNVKHLGVVRLDYVVLEGEATPGLHNATTVYVLTTDKHAKDMVERYFPSAEFLKIDPKNSRMAVKLVPVFFFFSRWLRWECS